MHEYSRPGVAKIGWGKITKGKAKKSDNILKLIKKMGKFLQ
jgi:hypothetical protein